MNLLDLNKIISSFDKNVIYELNNLHNIKYNVITCIDDIINFIDQSKEVTTFNNKNFFNFNKFN